MWDQHDRGHFLTSSIAHCVALPVETHHGDLGENVGLFSSKEPSCTEVRFLPGEFSNLFLLPGFSSLMSSPTLT